MPGKKALDPEQREKQVIDAAINLAEQQIQDGTASPSVLVHFLKLGTEKEKLERELLKAKASQIESAQTSEASYHEALDALQGYSPKGNKNDEVVD